MGLSLNWEYVAIFGGSHEAIEFSAVHPALDNTTATPQQSIINEGNPNVRPMVRAILINLRYEELVEKTLRSGVSLFLVDLAKASLQTLAG